MPLEHLLSSLGEDIDDPEEETFLLFSQQISSQDLGFVDARATSLEINVCGRDLNIRQSPTLLSSVRVSPSIIFPFDNKMGSSAVFPEQEAPYSPKLSFKLGETPCFGSERIFCSLEIVSFLDFYL